jgi:hypothetical protein
MDFGLLKHSGLNLLFGVDLGPFLVPIFLYVKWTQLQFLPAGIPAGLNMIIYEKHSSCSEQGLSK